MRCPKCDTECIRDEVDNGLGIEYGPWSCPGCGWSEDYGGPDILIAEENYHCKRFEVGYRDQRYEITYLDSYDDERKVFGWTDEYSIAETMRDSIHRHPSWKNPEIRDLQADEANKESSEETKDHNPVREG